LEGLRASSTWDFTVSTIALVTPFIMDNLQKKRERRVAEKSADAVLVSVGWELQELDVVLDGVLKAAEKETAILLRRVSI